MITPVERLFEAHLVVADLDASIAFYRDRLGLELAHVVPARQAAFFWIGSRGNSMLGLWTGGSAPQKTTTHIAFAASADDVIAAPRRCSQRASAARLQRTSDRRTCRARVDAGGVDLLSRSRWSPAGVHRDAAEGAASRSRGREVA